jgi:predicted TIM-barrel fold metal-dependent hydrolase
LAEQMSELEIIDAHEHLPPESERLSRPVDVLTLFSHYTQTDLKSAGMPEEDVGRLQDPEVPLPERWALFRPYWESIRHGSYARPALLAAREFYGADDINDRTFMAISERMQAANTPGLYRRILRDKCRIKACLTQIGRIPEADRDLLVPLLPLGACTNVWSEQQIEQLGADLGRQVSTLDDLLEAVKTIVHGWKREGVVGLKIVSHAYPECERGEAEQVFGQLTQGHQAPAHLLNSFLTHEVLDLAAELDLVVAVHCGIIWDNWNDVRTTNPTQLIPILMRHRDTKFDLYHAGIPWVRETGVIAKAFPNVTLNLCWTHVISPRMTRSALDEWLDLVPVNKIIGFGGDYSRPVEKVWGHLVMAREDIAHVLAGRIEEGLMSEDEALRIARLWLHDNPKELYGLAV